MLRSSRVRPIVRIIAALTLLSCASAGNAYAQQSTPSTSSSTTDDTDVQIHGFFVGSYSYNQRIQMVPEFAGGAQALADPGRSNFRFDKFGLSATRAFSRWLSASATVEIESHRDRHAHGFAPGFGCPGTAPCVERFGSEEPTVESNLDKFQVTLVAPVGNGLSFSVGRFDLPFGYERHDEPLNFNATASELFQFGRPQKMTGLQTSYVFSPHVDVTGWIVNRWESETTHTPFDDNNAGKSIGGRIGFTPVPTERLMTFGVGTFYGSEQDESDAKRWVVDVDFTAAPRDRLVVAAEALWGGEDGVSLRRLGAPYAAPALENGETRWWGFYVLPHYDVRDWAGITVRYGAFRDRDASRTGVDQTLQSVTLTPVFHLSALAPNARTTGAAYARTPHPIHLLDLKVEYRFNHSDKTVFSNAEPGVDIPTADHSGQQFQAQFVLNF